MGTPLYGYTFSSYQCAKFYQNPAGHFLIYIAHRHCIQMKTIASYNKVVGIIIETHCFVVESFAFALIS